MASSISAFFPAYNDGGTIASMVITALQALREVADDYEVVVVQNGSSDYTREVLAELQTLYPRELRVLDYPDPLGYGGALRTGFAACTKDLIFYTDGDAQYDPRELVVLYRALPAGVDMVNGYKIHRNDPINRKIIGRLYHHAVRIAFGLRLRDVDCDFRLIRRDVLDVIHLESNTGIICVELMKKIQEAGFRIEQVPVHHFHRAFGVSQFFNFRRVARTLLDLADLWYRLVLRREARRPERTALVHRPAPADVGAATGVGTEGRR